MKLLFAFILFSIGEYFVTEKTDGVRQLMVVVGSGGGAKTVFVDRAIEKDNNGRNCGLQVRDCPGPVLLPPGSVLDGELVFNLHLRKHVFMVFDALQVIIHLPPHELLIVMTLYEMLFGHKLTVDTFICIHSKITFSYMS